MFIIDLLSSYLRVWHIPLNLRSIELVLPNQSYTPRLSESTFTPSPLLAKAKRHSRIIPQAVSVRYGLSIGARCVPVVLALMYFFGSRSYPSVHFLYPTHQTFSSTDRVANS